MKKVLPAYMLLFLAAATLLSCAPVISRDLMDTGIRNVTLSEVIQKPDLYRGKLFILGGVIVNTSVTPEGSLIEAYYVAVDSQGYLTGGAGERYFAILPKNSGALNPQTYRNGKRITVAAEFVRVREDILNKSGHPDPFFEVRQIYLWEERPNDYRYPPGFYWRYGPTWWE